MQASSFTQTLQTTIFLTFDVFYSISLQSIPLNCLSYFYQTSFIKSFSKPLTGTFNHALLQRNEHLLSNTICGTVQCSFNVISVQCTSLCHGDSLITRVPFFAYEQVSQEIKQVYQIGRIQLWYYLCTHDNCGQKILFVFLSKVLNTITKFHHYQHDNA